MPVSVQDGAVGQTRITRVGEGGSRARGATTGTAVVHLGLGRLAGVPLHDEVVRRPPRLVLHQVVAEHAQVLPCACPWVTRDEGDKKDVAGDASGVTVGEHRRQGGHTHLVAHEYAVHAVGGADGEPVRVVPRRLVQQVLDRLHVQGHRWKTKGVAVLG